MSIDAEVQEDDSLSTASFERAQRRSDTLWRELGQRPERFRVLTGERPTGPLHIGHLFGTLLSRVKLQQLGVETFVVIADYQVLTDREQSEELPRNVEQVVLDYLACGLAPERHSTHIFPHSHVPALNQLLVAFLPLVTLPELDRNPTVKEEIRASGGKSLNASTYVYPLHQAADILFCQANLVPVGKDQLPHLELTRRVARRFNERFGATFPEPDALLSETPLVLGLDGQKMSKSRNNAILIGFDEDQTARAIRSAKTDSERRVFYDPERRPELSNLLRLLSLTTGSEVERLAEEIGDGGAGLLKARLTDALNAYLAPMRLRRRQLAEDRQALRAILQRGIEVANTRAERSLRAVREAMNMAYQLD